jgi:hypothetical protein
VKVKDLMLLLAQQDPNATVVVLDRPDFVRCGLLRPLAATGGAFDSHRTRIRRVGDADLRLERWDR